MQSYIDVNKHCETRIPLKYRRFQIIVFSVIILLQLFNSKFSLKIFTDLLFYALCSDAPSENTGLWHIYQRCPVVNLTKSLD